MIKLIFINLYGTILPENGEPIIRDGFIEFLNRYKSVRIAISTYASKDVAVPDLIKTGLIDKAENVYTKENMNSVRVYNKERNDLKDGYLQPFLKVWVRQDFRISENEAIVISDNSLDMVAADWYNVKAIKVPTFKDKYDDFSFDDISIGSRYNDMIYFIQRLRQKPRIISFK